MPEHTVLRTAEFDPKVTTYWMISSMIVCVVTIVGIPLIPIVWLIGRALIRKYLDNLGCTLTTRTLEVRKGILNRVESTIPLEKITDLQMFQGPIMRAFDLRGFKVETAGQTNTAGALLSIVGIVDAPAFRQAVLERRDQMQDAEDGGGRRTGRTEGDGASGHTAVDGAVLVEIRDALLRIEERLGERAGRVEDD